MSATAEYVSAFEAERLIQDLKKFTLEQVGSVQWMNQHEIMEKLNIQAHKNLTSQSEEFVSEAIITHQKVSKINKIETLIYDLILIEQWKTKVYPSFKKEFIQHNSMAAYFILYHEATIVNLLLVILYHPGACKEAGEVILDLIHYIFNKMQMAIQWKHSSEKVDMNSLMNQTELERFEESIRETDFSISMNCLGMLRSITDQINDVPLSALNLLLIEKDMVVTLVQLLESTPWIRKRKDLERFEIGGWQKIKEEDLELVSKLEGQVWLALMNLLLEPECKKKYQYSKQNQSVVLRLKEYISQNTVDQLPPLVDLQRYLEELLMMAPPDYLTPQSSIQPVSEIYSDILNTNLKKVIENHRKQFLSMNEQHKKAMANRYNEFIRLAKMYDLDGVEELIQDPKCGSCGLPADQRCSLCKSEWYCGRACQVKVWKQHKPICELLRQAAATKPGAGISPIVDNTIAI